jgi:hypothetical protein
MVEKKQNSQKGTLHFLLWNVESPSRCLHNHALLMLMPYMQGIPGLVASVDLSTGDEGFTSNLANDRNAIAVDNP